MVLMPCHRGFSLFPWLLQLCSALLLGCPLAKDRKSLMVRRWLAFLPVLLALWGLVLLAAAGAQERYAEGPEAVSGPSQLV